MHRDLETELLPSRPRVRAARSIIAVVGIDHYPAWPRLTNAVNDAVAISWLFKQLGFTEVTAPLLNAAATCEAMRRLVTDDLGRRLAPDDSLVLFFAGHGHTHTSFGDAPVKTGCVIPVDAASPDGYLAASWLRLDAWLKDIALLPPRHILVIVDACHSGIALCSHHKWRDVGSGAADADQQNPLRLRRSRRIITSALDTQRAMDGGPYPGHSLFTGCLIEGLSGGLAEAGRRAATGSEIGLYLQRRVTSYLYGASQDKQTPDFGAFEYDARGEILVPILPLDSTTTSRRAHGR
ncbi:MAG: caspase family protein [Deltaproteobacteria bacterium]|nr:MAG: caspase family protein [Deltaproteobacteria bacterium]TMQ20520.1 MAG: caspase family protein [Deltaproteobacteria bacterium]